MINRDLVELLSSASTDVGAWKNVCDAFAREFGGIGAVIAPENAEYHGPWLTSSDALLPAFKRYWTDGWSDRDIRRRVFRLGEAAPVIVDTDLGDLSVLARHPFYAEFLRDAALGGFISLPFKLRSERWVLSIINEPGRFVITEKEFNRAVAYRDHLWDAARFADGIGSQRIDAFKTTFSDLGKAFIILDVKGRFIDGNKLAETLLDDAYALVERRVRLVDKSRDDAFQRRLISVLATNNRRDSPVPLIAHCLSGAGIQIEVIRVPDTLRGFHFSSAAIVSISPYSTDEVRLSVQLQEKGFSKAEARIAQMIASGLKVRAAAEQAQVTEGTARQQLKAAFRKAGVSGQAELIRWLRQFDPNIG